MPEGVVVGKTGSGVHGDSAAGKDAGAGGVHFEEQKDSHGAQKDSHGSNSHGSGSDKDVEEDKGDMTGGIKVINEGKGGVIMQKLGNATAK